MSEEPATSAATSGGPESSAPGTEPGQHPRYHRRLTPWFIFAQASITFRARFWRVFMVAAAIAVTASVLDTSVDWLADEYQHHLPFFFGFLLAASSILLTGANSFGSIFLSGVLDKTVGEHQHGHRAIPLPELFRTLPFFTLFVADLLVVLARAAGLILFVVPGLIVVSLTAIVGPVIIIENRKAWSAITRSIELVRPHFWLVFVTATIPLGLEGFAEEFLEGLAVFHSFLGHTIIGLCLEVPLITWVALVEVTLAYHLLERDTPGSITAHSD